MGVEDGNATILFYADEGDDANDVWLAQATTSNEFDEIRIGRPINGRASGRDQKIGHARS